MSEPAFELGWLGSKQSILDLSSVLQPSLTPQPPLQLPGMASEHPTPYLPIMWSWLPVLTWHGELRHSADNEMAGW